MSAKYIKGTINIPGDKSISHRAIMFGALACGKTVIKGFLASDDCINTINCFRQLGVKIKQKRDKVIIKSKGMYSFKAPEKELYVGNSGTTIRIMIGILAGLSYIDKEIIITGDESICKRPMARVVEPLRQMGADIKVTGEKYAPLYIKPQKLKGIEYNMPIASAQVKSCLLMAGLFAQGQTSIIENKPSRDHTEKMLKYFNVPIEINNNVVKINSIDKIKANNIKVPADISSAAFFIAAALIVPGSLIKIKKLGMNPTRNKIIDVFKNMGAKITILKQYKYGQEEVADIEVGSSQLKGIDIRGDVIPNIIDEIPIICLVASQAEGKTEISDAKELRVKESDRIANTVGLLKQVGINIEEKEDGMIVHGPNKLYQGEVESFGDHRMAMMMAIANLISEGEIKISNIDCVKTSFPNFFDLLYT